MSLPPAPSRSVWDFDHEAVTTWDTDVTAASSGALTTAITNAMGAASDTNHRITVTFTLQSADVVIFTAAAIPDPSVNILIIPDTSCVFEGELRLNGPSNCKFVDFDFRSIVGGGASQCIDLLRSDVRLSFYDCDFGHLTAGLSTPANYPTCFGGGTRSGTEITVNDCRMNRVREVLDGREGLHHFEDNEISEFIDDIFALTVRNTGSKLCYLYAAGNVALNPVDDASFSALHPDFIQTGSASDTSGDEYEVESYQNAYLGSTIVQYPTQGLFGSLDTGAASGCTITSKDNIYLVTGNHGLTISDKRSDLQGNLIGKPPTTGRIPTGGNFPATLQLQEIRTAGDATDGTAATPVITGAVAGAYNDADSWGFTPTNILIADHTATLGGGAAYDTMFPNMTGLTYDTDQVVIPAYTGDEDKASVLAYLSVQYQPLGGWSGIGMTDPALWGVETPAGGSDMVRNVTLKDVVNAAMIREL